MNTQHDREAVELAAVCAPTRNYSLVRRAIDPRWVTACEQRAAHEALRVERIFTVDEPLDAPLFDASFDEAVRAQLERDALRWAALFCALLDERQCKLTLASVRTDSCRKFHADFVRLRALCTYAGPGTELVDDAHVHREVHMDTSRSLRAIADANAQMILDPSKILRANTGDLVALKGELWPFNRGRGAIHRSPPIEASGQRRLVLTIDALPPAAAR